jgi:hypothetical protein
VSGSIAAGKTFEKGFCLPTIQSSTLLSPKPEKEGIILHFEGSLISISVAVWNWEMFLINPPLAHNEGMF